ncbi:hypothetical protein BH09BAC1_BH09BAC1_19180 [soil metagenome]
MMPIPHLAKVSATNSNVYAAIGHVFSWVMIIMALNLYQERLNIDASYYLFKVINYEWFRVECGRLVLALSQIMPLVAVKLGLSMKTVLLAFSVNPPIYYYIFFNIFLYAFRNIGFALVMVLTQLIGLTHGYFTPMFELYYVVPWILLCYLLLQREGNWWRYLLMVITAAFALSSHMAGIILVMFVVGLDFLENRRFRFVYWFILVFVLGLVFIYKALFPAPYETEIMSFSFDFSRNQRYKNLFDVWYLKTLIKYFIQYYWEAMLLMGPPILLLFFTHRRWQLLYVFAAFGGYLLLIQVMYYAIIMTRYMNQVYFPIVIISAIVFAYSLKWFPQYLHKLLAILIVAILISRLYTLTGLSTDYRSDISMMHNLITKARTMGGSKFTTRYGAVAHDEVIGAHWSFSIQTMLLSSIEGPDNALTIHFDKYFTGLALDSNEHLFRFQEAFADSSLNDKYFRLQPGYYKPLQRNLPDSITEISSWDKLLWNVRNESILPKNKIVSQEVVLDVDRFDTVYVDPLNQIFFSYHWLQNSDTIVWDGIRTAVEVDITGEYAQRILLQTPTKPGMYTLQVELVHENVGWFGNGKRYNVEIR